MTIRYELMNELLGMPLESAVETINESGHRPLLIPEDALHFEHVPPRVNTVYVFHANGIVTFACASDPNEVKEEQ